MNRSSLHVCDRGGALVPGFRVIPSDPADFAWTPAATGVGCGRILCRACGDVEASAPLEDGGRRYRCACGEVVVHSQQWLDAQPPNAAPDFVAPRARAPSTWACGGHPARRFPLELDGVSIESDPDWAAMLSASVGGLLGAQLPPWLPAYPNAWIERLIATVDASECARFARVAVGLLDETDTRLRRAGLDIAARIGLASVAANVVERVALGAFDWEADEHLTRFVIEQLRRRCVESPPGAELQDAVRRAALAGHGAALVFALGRHDASWLAENAGTLLGLFPRAKTKILAALAQNPRALAHAKRVLDGEDHDVPS